LASWKLGVERLEDGEAGVEAHEVEELEREPIGKVAAALHRRVDVVARR